MVNYALTKATGEPDLAVESMPRWTLWMYRDAEQLETDLARYYDGLQIESRPLNDRLGPAVARQARPHACDYIYPAWDTTTLRHQQRLCERSPYAINLGTIEEPTLDAILGSLR